MSFVTARWRGGHIEPEQPVHWPDGTLLRVEAWSGDLNGSITEETWPTTPEGIAGLLREMEESLPIELTPEEEAEWEAARRDQRALDVAAASDRTSRAEKDWE